MFTWKLSVHGKYEELIFLKKYEVGVHLRKIVWIGLKFSDKNY